MPDITPSQFKRNTKKSPKPSMDVVVNKGQAAHFPTVGMTLSSYKNPKLNSDKRSQFKAAPKETKSRRFFNRTTLKRSIITVLVLAIGIGLILGGQFLYDLHKAFGGSVFDLLHTSKLKGEDVGRVNILLAGDSSDDPNHQGADLTDSIMLVSINTRNNTAWMLSIPRDLWVYIPKNGYGKINAAYEYGNQDHFSSTGYPNGGMGQLEQIVSQKFNIPIDYYALIDYSAFKQSVDAVGGITITINSNDPRGLYDKYTHLKLPNGQVVLNGQQALSLARARGDADIGNLTYGFTNGDFDRTLHQREMLVALQQKVTSSSVLANPVSLSKLFNTLGNNVKTDMNLSNARRLYDLSKKIPNSKIQSLSLINDNGNNLLKNYGGGGQSALIPAAGINDFSDIQRFVAKHTSNNPIVQEGAKVVVLNGTNVNGLANIYKNKLEAVHVSIDHTGDAYSSRTLSTTIYDLSSGKMPATMQQIIRLLGNNVSSSYPYYNSYDADFIIVLGEDKASTQ